MGGEGREEVRVRGDGEVRRRREEGEVVLDDGVMEGERRGGGEGRREEERSVQGDALWRESVGETRPLFRVEMLKIYLSLLPPLPLLLLSLFSPHPLLLPLLSLLFHPLPLHLSLLLLLSLFLRISFLLLLLSSHQRSDVRSVSGAIVINNITTAITISDMITVKVITPNTVNIVTAIPVRLINTAAGFVINR